MMGPLDGVQQATSPVLRRLTLGQRNAACEVAVLLYIKDAVSEQTIQNTPILDHMIIVRA
jgi:hypothetical protein